MRKKKQTVQSAWSASTDSARLADPAVALAEYAALILVAAEQVQIRTMPVEGFPLTNEDRATLGQLSSVAGRLQTKLATNDGRFTVAETASLLLAIAESFHDAGPMRQLALAPVAQKLMECLQASLVRSGMPQMGASKPGKAVRARKPGRAKKPGSASSASSASSSKPAEIVFQFKITLLESRPSIWRRIQVRDCTLDQLHEYIQTAMGWTNSHLHHFTVGEQLYGDPDLLQENFEDLACEDSTTTTISDILPNSGKGFRFRYEYDFGDSWHHEVLFEGTVQTDGKTNAPRCLEGARACPPEDCGGIKGYPDFVEAIRNPGHARHAELLEWIGGRFDPDEFDPVKATKAMKQGLPDWRSMAEW